MNPGDKKAGDAEDNFLYGGANFGSSADWAGKARAAVIQELEFQGLQFVTRRWLRQ